MKKISNKKFVEAYLKVYDEWGGIIDITRALHGEQAESGGPEYRSVEKQVRDLIRDGVRLPNLAHKPLSDEAAAINEMIENR